MTERIAAVGHDIVGASTATVRAIAGARLETIRGMGHDLPQGARPVLLDLIDDEARRGGRPGTTRSTDAATAP
jgi:hypothetical protein